MTPAEAARRLTAARERAGLSSYRLAKTLDIPPQTQHNMESTGSGWASAERWIRTLAELGEPGFDVLMSVLEDEAMSVLEAEAMSVLKDEARRRGEAQRAQGCLSSEPDRSSER